MYNSLLSNLYVNKTFNKLYLCSEVGIEITLEHVWAFTKQQIYYFFIYVKSITNNVVIYLYVFIWYKRRFTILVQFFKRY